jgi:hypothetical protein
MHAELCSFLPVGGNDDKRIRNLFAQASILESDCAGSRELSPSIGAFFFVQPEKKLGRKNT